MPCNSDYMEPTAREINRVKHLQLLIWLKQKIKEPIPNDLIKASRDIYGEGWPGNNPVVELCHSINKIGEKQFTEMIIDNINDPMATECMTFWTRHKQADKERIAEEERRERERIRDIKINKVENLIENLSNEQLDALINQISDD